VTLLCEDTYNISQALKERETVREWYQDAYRAGVYQGCAWLVITRAQVCGPNLEPATQIFTSSV